MKTTKGRPSTDHAAREAAASVDELRQSLEEGIALYLAEPGEPAPTVELQDFHVTPVETTASVALAHA